ncbi:hypothetical protein [Microbispora sp. NPDC049125]|uniref:hypothetical protein n=1 Tax=Microbispora sp. NPDC049125 TaxID=3154929 RepID=UPI003467DB0A
MAALSKGDVVALLTDRGLGQGHAESIAAELRMSRSPNLPQSVALAVEAGVIDPDRVGVYLFTHATQGAKIARIEDVPPGHVTILGTFGHDPKLNGRGTYFEPAEPGSDQP